MICSRCGVETPRLTIRQTRCPQCQRQVEELLRIDARRNERRTWTPKDLTGTVPL